MPRKATKMTDAHKKALASGREQSRAIRDYLEALESAKPRRGRQRTQESIEKRLATIEASLSDGAGPLQRLLLTQERTDLEYELEVMNDGVAGPEDFEADFVKHAAAYAQSKGISYATFRACGVPADVLQRSGITRSM